MSVQTDLPIFKPSPTGRHTSDTRIAVVVVVIAVATLFAALGFTLTSNGPAPTFPISSTTQHTAFPTGTADSSEPSGKAPPGPNALAGYTLSYVHDFTGTSLPAGWDAFSGVPGGDPGGQFGLDHDVVSGGLLRLETYKDPAYNDKWVSGGVCQCGQSQTYGAYFVRSRVTGAGPTQVEMLWPAQNVWPPEIDFDETGGTTTGTSATLHYGAVNNLDQRSLNINMTQWHTWGVIWTPKSITYVVDGHAWAAVTAVNEVPHQPMSLHLQQQTSCDLGFSYACPTAPVSMLVDWVAAYTPK
jgi:hypothetical protein